MPRPSRTDSKEHTSTQELKAEIEDEIEKSIDTEEERQESKRAKDVDPDDNQLFTKTKMKFEAIKGKA